MHIYFFSSANIQIVTISLRIVLDTWWQSHNSYVLGIFYSNNITLKMELLCLSPISPGLFECSGSRHTYTTTGLLPMFAPPALRSEPNFWQCRGKMSELYCYWIVQWETILNLSNIGVPLIILCSNWIVIHVTWALFTLLLHSFTWLVHI